MSLLFEKEAHFKTTSVKPTFTNRPISKFNEALCYYTINVVKMVNFWAKTTYTHEIK